MTSKAALDYINSFINFEKIPQYDYASSFKLERMQAILSCLGNPHQGLKIIHIAGSKGKGSTCATIASILMNRGLKVGLYTSPHLLDMRERIRLLSKGIEQEDAKKDFFYGRIKEYEFMELIDRLRPIAEKFRDHGSLGKVSFFEILTAIAFLYFRDKEADCVILETGLGGRLDATNVAEPMVCGITNISMEHMDKLGNTLEAIAGEKVGIIKSCDEAYDVVSAPQEPEVINVIRGACKDKNVPLCEIGRDVRYKVNESSEYEQLFDIEGPGYLYNNLRLNLLGEHQIENASVSIAILKLLEKNGFKISEDDIRKGLENVSWPGRLEIVQHSPYVILDGAQNRHSIEAVCRSIRKAFNYNRLICVFGISSDKDIKGVTEVLDEFSNMIILTRADSKRAKEPSDLKRYFTLDKTYLTKAVDEALDAALREAGERDLILVTGSLFVVGEAMKSFLH